MIYFLFASVCLVIFIAGESNDGNINSCYTNDELFTFLRRNRFLKPTYVA